MEQSNSKKQKVDRADLEYLGGLGLDDNDILMSLEGILGWKRDEGALKVVLLHQLYNIFPNKTYVDSEIQKLKESGQIRIFMTQAGKMIMRNQEYARDILDLIANLDPADKVGKSLAKFLKWSTCNQTSILRDRLLSGVLHVEKATSHSRTSGSGSENGNGNARKRAIGVEEDIEESNLSLLEEDINNIVRAGFLLHRRDAENAIAFFFHHPKIGVTVQTCISMRSQILSILNKVRFKEMQEKKIAKSKLAFEKNLSMDLKFYLEDLLGSGKITFIRQPSTGERIWRIPN